MADPGRLDELKRKFEENPRRYFAPLANEYRKAGDVDHAIELCRTYLPQQPTHMSGYIVYGQALYDAGRSDEAAQVFQQALSLDPENIIALRYLGDIARSEGDAPGALRWYGKVLELDPRNEEIAGYVAELNGTPQPRRTDGPERPVPPTVHPEPEPDGNALALEELMAEPDRPQPEIQRPPQAAVDAVVVEESLAIIEWPTEEIEPPLGADLVPPTADQGVTSMMDFGLDEAWPAMGGLETSSRFEPPAEERAPAPEPAASAQGAAEDRHGDASEGAAEEAPDEAPDEAAEEAPAEEPAPEHEPEHEPAEAAVAESDVAPSAGVESEAPIESSIDAAEGEPLAGAVAASAADESPLVDESQGPPAAAESPFMTETMAELYVAQGLHADALAIYRQLAQRRDEPRLHERIAALEAQLAPPAEAETGAEVASAQPLGETVREFFARIGERRPQAVARIGAEGEAGLGRIFGGASLDANDVTAAESLAGAFTSGSAADGSRSA